MGVFIDIVSEPRAVARIVRERIEPGLAMASWLAALRGPQHLERKGPGASDRPDCAPHAVQNESPGNA